MGGEKGVEVRLEGLEGLEGLLGALEALEALGRGTESACEGVWDAGGVKKRRHIGEIQLELFP